MAVGFDTSEWSITGRKTAAASSDDLRSAMSEQVFLLSRLRRELSLIIHNILSPWAKKAQFSLSNVTLFKSKAEQGYKTHILMSQLRLREITDIFGYFPDQIIILSEAFVWPQVAAICMFLSARLLAPIYTNNTPHFPMVCVINVWLLWFHSLF